MRGQCLRSSALPFPGWAQISPSWEGIRLHESPLASLPTLGFPVVNGGSWPLTDPGQWGVLANRGETFDPFLGHRSQQPSFFLPLGKLPEETAVHRAFIRPFEDGWSIGPDTGRGQAGSAPPRLWVPRSPFPSFFSYHICFPDTVFPNKVINFASRFYLLENPG